MTERSASNTAVGVAYLRAAHQLIDAAPRLLDDPVILRLLGDGAEARLRDGEAQLQSTLWRALRSHVVLRSRFAEDSLADAVARGVRQYVVLGAGLDTFALRQPAWAHDLRVFEVDQPATQTAKRGGIAQAGLTVPPNVTFVPLDFEHVSLADGLAAGGVDLARPVFFSWLGVTMYLTAPAIDAVFRTVAALPSGTEIVLTFAQPDADGEAAHAFAESAAAVGEPWLSYFTPEELEARLRGAGFTSVRFLTPAEAAARYYQHRPDGLLPPRRTAIAAARV
jgi:methyltransferase (TIGR00027 family)